MTTTVNNGRVTVGPLGRNEREGIAGALAPSAANPFVVETQRAAILARSDTIAGLSQGWRLDASATVGMESITLDALPELGSNLGWVAINPGTAEMEMRPVRDVVGNTLVLKSGTAESDKALARNHGTDTLVRWMPEPVWDVTWFGARPGNASATTLAFQRAFADIPASTILLGGGRPTASYRLNVPASDTPYRINSLIERPKDKNVLIFTDTPRGAVLEYTGAGPYMFRSGPDDTTGKHGVFEIENLVLWKGGVALPAKTRGHTSFRSVYFYQTPGYAIDMLAEVLVSGRLRGTQVWGLIDRCFFHECFGGVWVRGQSADGWILRHSQFQRNVNSDVVLNTSGWSLYDNDFSLRPVAKFAQPFVIASRDHVQIAFNRFGGETRLTDSVTGNPLPVEEQFAPPREAVLLGPAPADGSGVPTPTLGTAAVQSVLINGNIFKSTHAEEGGDTDDDNLDPTPTSAAHMVRLLAAVANTRIVDNTTHKGFWGSLVQEQYIHEDPLLSSLSYGNIFANNGLNYRHRGESTFSRGGFGWNIPDAQPSNRGRARRANFLRTTTDLTNATHWTVTNLTATQNMEIAGPDGVVGSAFTLTRTSTGNADIYGTLQLGALPADADRLVFSVWLRAGTHNRIRLIFRDQTLLAFATQDRRAITLTGEWVRHHVILPRIRRVDGAPHNYRVYMRLGTFGPEDAALTSGTIHVYGPQVEVGSVPLDYLSNPTGNIREIPFQAQVVGSNVIASGTSPAVIVNPVAGDQVLNTAPTNTRNIARWTRTTNNSWRATGTGRGGTAQRPADLGANDLGYLYWDTSLGRIIHWGGAAWDVGVE